MSEDSGAFVPAREIREESEGHAFGGPEPPEPSVDRLLRDAQNALQRALPEIGSALLADDLQRGVERLWQARERAAVDAQLVAEELEATLAERVAEDAVASDRAREEMREARQHLVGVSDLLGAETRGTNGGPQR